MMNRRIKALIGAVAFPAMVRAAPPWNAQRAALTLPGRAIERVLAASTEREGCRLVEQSRHAVVLQRSIALSSPTSRFFNSRRWPTPRSGAHAHVVSACAGRSRLPHIRQLV